MKRSYLLEFSTDHWRYQTLLLSSLNRVQLWYRMPRSAQWELGHGKDIPQGMTADQVAETMRLYILGDISFDEYNDILPR